VVESKIHVPPHLCYQAEFGGSATKGVRINRKEPQNWGALGPRPLAVGFTDFRLTPTNRLLPHVLSRPLILVVLGPMVRVSVIKRDPSENFDRAVTIDD